MATWVYLKTTVYHYPVGEDDALNEALSVDVGEKEIGINFDLVEDWYQHEDRIYVNFSGKNHFTTYIGTSENVKEQIRKSSVTNLFKTS